MSSIKLKHSGGNGVSITAPDTNPSSDRTVKLPSTDVDGVITTKDSNDSLQAVTGLNGTAFSNRNMVSNGAMMVAQRTTGNVTAHLGFPVDRFRVIKDTSAGSFTAIRNGDAPVGIRDSLLYTVGTAFTPSASENAFIKTALEGFDTAHLEFGSSDAKTVTLSFYVKSSLTGNFGAAIVNGASDRSFPFTYTISSANTWTRITKTITGDTTGTWAVGGVVAFQLVWALSVGSNFQGTANTWQGSAEYSVSGAVSLTSTAGATFQLTGVQFELGTVATDFEHKLFSVELAACQRYCQIVRGHTRNDYRSNNAARTGNNMNYFTEMRAAPTATTLTAVHSQNMSSVLYERVDKRGLSFTAVGIATVGGTDGQQLMNDVPLEAEM